MRITADTERPSRFARVSTVAVVSPFSEVPTVMRGSSDGGRPSGFVSLMPLLYAGEKAASTFFMFFLLPFFLGAVE